MKKIIVVFFFIFIALVYYRISLKENVIIKSSSVSKEFKKNINLKTQKLENKILITSDRLLVDFENNCDDCLLRNLKKFKGDINFQFKTGDTLLSMAIGDGNSKITAELLKRGANPNIEFNNYNYTLAMDSSFQGHIDTLKLLIKYGADLNAIDKEGKSALIYASKEGHYEIVKELLKNGANLVITDQNHKTALDYAKKYQFLRLIKLLKGFL